MRRRAGVGRLRWRPGAIGGGLVRRPDVGRGAATWLALVLAALVLLQVTLVCFVPTPVTAPDLVVVTVLALAITRGPHVAGLAGAWAGLLYDLAPPAAGPFGGWALVLGLAGYVAGRVAGAYRPGPLTAMAMLALGAVGVVLARAAVVWFAGAPVGASALAVAAASGLMALLLAPVALLLAMPGSPAPTAPMRTVPGEVTGP